MQPVVMQSGNKRFASGPRRPVDKDIFVSIDAVTTSNVVNTVHQSTVAETFSGGHVSGTISFATGSSVATADVLIALTYVKGGQGAITFSVADNSTLEPESSFLYVFIARGSTGNTTATQAVPPTTTITFDHKIKAQRKMLKEDVIQWNVLGSAANVAVVNAVITCFFKQ